MLGSALTWSITQVRWAVVNTWSFFCLLVVTLGVRCWCNNSNHAGYDQNCGSHCAVWNLKSGVKRKWLRVCMIHYWGVLKTANISETVPVWSCHNHDHNHKQKWIACNKQPLSKTTMTTTTTTTTTTTCS